MVFKAPAFDEKNIGVGWDPPYTGKITCPNCGSRFRRWRNQVPTSAPG